MVYPCYVHLRPIAPRLSDRDQFGRAVCTAYAGRWPFQKGLAEGTLKAGPASIYCQTEAQYGGKLEDGLDGNPPNRPFLAERNFSFRA